MARHFRFNNLSSSGLDERLEPDFGCLRKTIMLCYNSNIIASVTDCKESKLTAFNSHAKGLERPDAFPKKTGITHVQQVLRHCSLPFALLVGGVATASESPVDLPDVTVQAHVAEEGASDLHTPTTSGSRLELSALQTPASTPAA